MMMTRKRKLSEGSNEDVSSDSESENVSSDSESDHSSDHDKTDHKSPSISLLVQQLSKAVAHKNAMDLLHSMATSKDILFWNSYDEMLHHNRRIPVTSMVDLVEYALLSLRNKKTARSKYVHRRFSGNRSQQKAHQKQATAGRFGC